MTDISQIFFNVSNRLSQLLGVDGIAKVEIKCDPGGTDLWLTFEKPGDALITQKIEQVIKTAYELLPIRYLYVRKSPDRLFMEYPCNLVLRSPSLMEIDHHRSIPSKILNEQAKLLDRGFSCWIIDYDGVYLSVEMCGDQRAVQGDPVSIVGTRAMSKIPDQAMRMQVEFMFDQAVQTGQRNEYGYVTESMRPCGRWRSTVKATNQPYPENRLVLATTLVVSRVLIGEPVLV
jgi:hypothetical protein